MFKQISYIQSTGDVFSDSEVFLEQIFIADFEQTPQGSDYPV